MRSESILDEIAAETGWSDTTKLWLALTYIENQNCEDVWRDFLLTAQAEEEACARSDQEADRARRRWARSEEEK